jgi:outer membrane receptor protein involved in Fe transport
MLVGSTAMLMGMAVTGAAFAADAPAGGAAQPAASSEVVVTGSRIVRRDFTSNSPIVTVNSQAFEASGNVAVEATLNKLPEFTPTGNLTGRVGAGSSGDIQPTAVNTVGVSAASLRGFGANRNLVLVDGKRLTPVNGFGVVDLDAVPSSAIDHVEVITGGASAVYGADAIAGVVNFIMRKNFQGLDVDAQYLTSQHDDDHEFKVSALFGANFADDRGNVMLGLEHYYRGPTWQYNRSFYQNGWNDPTTGSNAFFNPGGGWLPIFSDFCPSYAAQDAEFGAPAAGFSRSCTAAIGLAPGTPTIFAGPFATEYLFNGEGAGKKAADGFDVEGSADPTTIFSMGANGGSLTLKNLNTTTGNYLKAWGSTMFPSVAYDTTGGLYFGGSTTQKVNQLKSIDTQIYLLSPLKRWSAYGQAHYDLNENISVFGNFNFTDNATRTSQVPSPFVFGWGVLVPYDGTADGNAAVNPSHHPVPTSLATLLSSRALNGYVAPGVAIPLGSNALLPWQLQLVPGVDGKFWLPARATYNEITNWQVQFGVDGKIPNTDWTVEAYGSHGQSSQYTNSTGNVSLERYRAMVLAPDWGKGFNFKGNTAAQGSSGPGFGAGTGTCTSGFYGAIFHNEAPSQDCIDSMTANLQSYTQITQDIAEIDTQGSIFKLPAGELRGSLGASIRRTHLLFTPDPLQSENSFLDQVAGLYPAGHVDTAVTAKDIYGELLVPVIADAPFVKALNLELGARYSWYTNSPGGWTYKIIGDWEVNNWMRFRGGYNLAVRAPGIGESFLPLQETFNPSTTRYGDPCSLQSNAPFGAGGADNAQLLKTTNGAKAVTPVTSAQAAANAYAICKALMTPTGATAYYGTSQPLPSGAGPAFTNQIGNPNLKPENAKTWTAGVVLRPPVRNPWIDRTTLSIDWYKITVSNAIEFSDVDYANGLCLSQDASTPAALAAAVASHACQGFKRTPSTGGLDLSTLIYGNLGYLSTSGIDAQLNWAIDFQSVGINQVPGSFNLNVLFNYLNYFKTRANPATSFEPAAPMYNWAGSLGPTDPTTNSGSFRYKIYTTGTYSVGPASLSLSWRHLPGVNTVNHVVVSQTPGTFSIDRTVPVSSHDEFDLFGTFTFMHNYTLRAGINNLFNVQPPITGASLGGLTSSAPGSNPVLPTTGAGTTNEGLYDTIGRRFFVGVKARF